MPTGVVSYCFLFNCSNSVLNHLACGIISLTVSDLVVWKLTSPVHVQEIIHRRALWSGLRHLLFSCCPCWLLFVTEVTRALLHMTNIRLCNLPLPTLDRVQIGFTGADFSALFGIESLSFPILQITARQWLLSGLKQLYSMGAIPPWSSCKWSAPKTTNYVEKPG